MLAGDPAGNGGEQEKAEAAPLPDAPQKEVIEQESLSTNVSAWVFCGTDGALGFSEQAWQW